MATANFTQICANILALNDKTKELNAQSQEMSLNLQKAQNENNLLKADLISQIARVSTALTQANEAMELAKGSKDVAIANAGLIQNACDEIALAQEKVKSSLVRIMEALVLADENVVFIKQTKNELGALCDEVKADLNSLATPVKEEFMGFVDNQKNGLKELINELIAGEITKSQKTLEDIKEAILSANEATYRLDNFTYRHETRFDSLVKGFDKVAFDTELLGAMMGRVSLALLKDDNAALSALIGGVEVPQTPSVDSERIAQLEAQVTEQKAELAALIAKLENDNENIIL